MPVTITTITMATTIPIMFILIKFITSKPSGLWQSCSTSLTMLLVMSRMEKRMTFDTICHVE